MDEAIDKGWIRFYIKVNSKRKSILICDKHGLEEIITILEKAIK